MTKPVKYLLVGLAVFALGFVLGISRNCGGLNKAYWVERSVYDRDIAAAAKLHEIEVAENKKLKDDNEKKDEDIRAKTGEIANLKGRTIAVQGEISGLEADNKKLRQDAQAAIDANPALQALVANFELQIAKHKEKEFSLEERLNKVGEPIEDGIDAAGKKIIVYPEGTVTWDLRQQCVNKDREIANLQAYGDREHGLRMTSDSMRIKAEKAAGRKGVIATVEGIVIGGTVTYFTGKALGHAFKLW